MSFRSYLPSPPPLEGGKGAQKRARAVIRLYREALKNQSSAGKTYGGKKINKRAVAPRDRPINVLKREIYRCAIEMKNGSVNIEVKQFIDERDRKHYKPRLSSTIDWAIRLICYQKPGPKAFDKYKEAYFDIDSGALLEPSSLSRIAKELNFAMECDIRWQLVDMFVEHVGGYEMISASGAANDTEPCRLDEWAGYLSTRCVLVKAKRPSVSSSEAISNTPNKFRRPTTIINEEIKDNPSVKRKDKLDQTPSTHNWWDD